MNVYDGNRLAGNKPFVPYCSRKCTFIAVALINLVNGFYRGIYGSTIYFFIILWKNFPFLLLRGLFEG